MRRLTAIALCLLPGILAVTGYAHGQPPALPPGLEDNAEEPPLPPGLIEDEETAPAETGKRGIPTQEGWLSRLHGFWEVRGGPRLQDDPAQPRDATLGETRLQLETDHAWERVTLEFTGDVIGDAVLEELDFDLRRLRLTWTPLHNLDLSIGRQVLTWGTGDLLFINDLFPKDWQAFFIGRDEEYLKAPADTVKVSWFGKFLNADLVYTPEFEPDRFITGERLSYWSPLQGSRAGRDNMIDSDAPSEWFSDDEIALRLYRTLGAYELALYTYSGYWKSPAGQRLVPMQATFPRLNAYGFSIRGPLGKGIVNLEAGYYDSRQDRKGDDPFIENSELRILIGYERELGKNFTAGIQYYLQHMLDYDAYRRTLPALLDPRDRSRHTLTLRLTKLLLEQNLTLSAFLFYSPSDNDAYVRPKATYKINDRWRVELGANLFLGEDDSTFLAQFEDNTNLYAAARISF